MLTNNNLPEKEMKGRTSGEEEANKELVGRFYSEANPKVREDLTCEDFVGRAPGMQPLDRDGSVRSLNVFIVASPCHGHGGAR